ncbi:16149_t:CDS:1 [Acaulospora colombiana]|uniref:16149_t:CDS:1 n=1 Tax=Acaulospora colombiana TaxID=27376 RepID=A0ACA9LNT5_9GLOM|nr:16149_t:CDS:1 [Acaulospora colombiana]
MVSSSARNGQQVVINFDDSPSDHVASTKTKDESNVSQSPVKETLFTIFQLLYNCKLATSDNFLKEKCRYINILDGSFYINTLQSLKYNDYLVSLAETVINYTDNLTAPPLNVGQLLQLMSIPKNLIKDSREKRELVVGIIRNYEDNLRSLRKTYESIKQHKKDLTRDVENMPVREVECKKCKEWSESLSEKSKRCLYLGAGVSLCNAFYMIVILLDGHMRISSTCFSIFTITAISLAILILGIKFHFDSIGCLKISEEIKANLEETRRVMANTNETDTKVIELNVTSLIRKIPIILDYWKDFKESLEELSDVFSSRGHNFDPIQMGDRWRAIKESCENYGQAVRAVLEQNDQLNGRDSKN